MGKLRLQGSNNMSKVILLMSSGPRFNPGSLYRLRLFVGFVYTALSPYVNVNINDT